MTGRQRSDYFRVGDNTPLTLTLPAGEPIQYTDLRPNRGAAT